MANIFLLLTDGHQFIIIIIYSPSLLWSCSVSVVVPVHPWQKSLITLQLSPTDFQIACLASNRLRNKKYSNLISMDSITVLKALYVSTVLQKWKSQIRSYTSLCSLFLSTLGIVDMPLALMQLKPTNWVIQ